MGKNETHPVWNVYDRFRTTRLNVKYYSARLVCVKKINFIMELILAISISSEITGSPIKPRKSLEKPSPSGLVGKSAIDFKTIKIISWFFFAKYFHFFSLPIV